MLLSTRPGVRYCGAVGAVTVAMLQRNLVRLYKNFAATSAAMMDASSATLSLNAGIKFVPPARPAGSLPEAAVGESWLTTPINDLALSELAAVSPVDGRYRRGAKSLSGFYSEHGLIRYRIHAEVEYFIALREEPVDLPL